MAVQHDTPPIVHLPDYAFGELIGKGSYGTVYKARLISSIQSRPSSAASVHVNSAPITFYAIKCISRKGLNKTKEDLLINEIKILKAIKHENIVEMYDFQWDENYIYIIMEYCSGGDLSMFIRSKQKLSESHARLFLKQIADVLKFLHERKISHMDLKPQNILLKSPDKPLVKVADFGMAQHIGKDGSRQVRGTLMYMAPEILAGRLYDGRVDLWSIGVILYECLFGRPPFPFIIVDDLIQKILSDTPIEIPQDPPISIECRQLLTELLQRDPNQRISFERFFQHPIIFDNLSAQVTHADDLLQQSINCEHLGDMKAALDYRIQALDEYASIIKIDEDPNRRRMLKMKIKQGVAEAEVLKRRIREPTPNLDTTPPLTNSMTTMSLVNSSDLDVNNDKQLFEAYQHCLNGNQFMNVFAFSKAIDEYEAGISVMLQAGKTETDPVKSKILRDMISHYLTKAETCKQRLENQRLDLAIENIKQDSANDETISTEKKTLNMSVPHCNQQ